MERSVHAVAVPATDGLAEVQKDQRRKRRRWTGAMQIWTPAGGPRTRRPGDWKGVSPAEILPEAAQSNQEAASLPHADKVSGRFSSCT